MSTDDEYYLLNDVHVDPKRLKRERDKARSLRKSHWWQRQVAKGRCHYCGERFSPAELTMDHVVPLARGGSSTRGNLVPACKACNQAKRLGTPVEELMKTLRS